MAPSGKGDDYLNGGKQSDCIIADDGADMMRGGSDGDDFVFGHCLDGSKKLNFGSGNMVLDFDDDNNDRLVFHTDFIADAQGGTMTATVGGADNEDITIAIAGHGDVTVKGLAHELGIDVNDEDFQGPDSVLAFLLTGAFDPDALEEDPEGWKGVIDFEDKCVETFTCKPVDPDTEWEFERQIETAGKQTFDAKYFGDTIAGTSLSNFVLRWADTDDIMSITDENGGMLIDEPGEGTGVQFMYDLLA